MRKIIALSTVVALMLVAIAPAVTAQNEEHPAVGSWVLDTDAGSPDNPLTLLTFHPDGTARDWTPNGTGVGAWEPTGERGLASTFLYPVVDPEAGSVAFVVARIVGDVSEDGQITSGTYTIEFPTEPEGVFPPPGEYGPAGWTATRIAVEAIGEPIGPWPLPPPPEE